MSPTLIHFIYVLVTASVVLIPTVTRMLLGILLLLVGLISFGRSLSAVPCVAGIRNAWDTVVWMVLRQNEPPQQ